MRINMTNPFGNFWNKPTIRVLGLMSGTSADGLDMCLAEFEGKTHYPSYRVLENHFVPYPEEFCVFRNPLQMTTEKIAEMNMTLGHWYGKMVKESGFKADIVANHGQTLLHNPPLYTVQIGDASATAYRCGIPVVHDFRTADVMLGGQGAPLIPIVDNFLLRESDNSVVALNMGGIANMTCLPPRESPLDILAWDTGPANTLIDKSVIEYTKGKMNYDDRGKIARSGEIDNDLLKFMLAHLYFSKPCPKSAGQEEFGKEYFNELLAKADPQTDSQWHTFIRTVTEMTVQSIARDIMSKQAIYNFSCCHASGGGAENAYIMERLAALLPGIDVKILKMDGIDQNNKEAFGFAYLGYLFVRQLHGNVITVTGAGSQAVLGRLCLNPVV